MKSVKDEPNTQREYETIFILKPTANAENIGLVNNRMRTVIENQKGKVLNLANWGRRKLAYEVKGELKGIYIYWQYLGTQGLVEEIERNLRLLDDVIRYLTVRVETNVVVEGRETKVTEETYVQASTTVPDEEQMMLSSSRFHAEDEFDPDLEELALERHREER